VALSVSEEMTQRTDDEDMQTFDVLWKADKAERSNLRHQKKENKMRKKQTGRDEYVQMIIKSMKSVWWAKKFMVERIC